MQADSVTATHRFTRVLLDSNIWARFMNYGEYDG